MTNDKRWNWIEVPAKDLADQTFESLTVKYRGEKPVGLLTALDNLSGYVVLNLFAPLHAVFWASAKFPGIVLECHDSLKNLYEDSDARRSFMKDLRQAKIRKGSKQARLFDEYMDRLQISGKSVTNLGEGLLNYSEKYRFQSLGFPACHQQAIMEFLEREVEEFGPFAFFRIDESVRLTDPRRWRSFGSYLFQGIDYFHFGIQAEREKLKQEVLAELKWVVTRLEDRIPFDVQIEPIWMIKGVVSFRLFPAVFNNAAEFDDNVARGILSYRARMVRLLGWPHQYHSVKNALKQFIQQKNELQLPAFEPYDVEAELEGYIDEMCRRYPILSSKALDQMPRSGV